jgi:hypothetical protein
MIAGARHAACIYQLPNTWLRLGTKALVREIAMVRHWIAILAFLGTSTAFVVPIAAPTLQDEPRSGNKESSVFMALKLKAAQSALNGVVVGDLALLESSATELVMLSRKAEFQLQKTAEYANHSKAFEQNAKELLGAARSKNLDGAALAYVQLSLNCVNCHKYTRDAR